MNILISNWIGPGVELRIGKGVRILVVSFRDVNFGFWSHLGCSGQNATVFSREGLVSVGVALEKYKNIYLICIFLIRFTYSIHKIQVFYTQYLKKTSLSIVLQECNNNMVSFRGQRKLGPRPDRSPLGV